MGFSFSKLNPFRAAKKATQAIAKPIRKISQKLIPKEIRPALPYLSAAMPFMLPGSFSMMGMNPAVSRGIMSGFGNVAAQAAADPEGENINLLSALLAGGSGALGAEGMGDSLRSGIVDPKDAVMSQIRGGELGLSQVPSNFAMPEVGFLQGAENLGREGLAVASDYLGGAREGLAGLGSDPGSVFTKAGAKSLGKNIAPVLTQGSADLAKTSADIMLRDFENTQAEEEAQIEETTTANASERAYQQMTMMRQADIPEVTIKETLEMNDIGEYYEPPVENAMNGGLMGRSNYKFGGITAALKTAGPNAMRFMRGVKREVLDKISQFRDDVEIQVINQDADVDYEGFMDYSYDIAIRPKTSRGQSILDELQPENAGAEEFAFSQGEGSEAIMDVKDAGGRAEGALLETTNYKKPSAYARPDDFSYYSSNPYAPRGGFGSDMDEIYEGLTYKPEKKAHGGIMNGYNMGGNVLPQGMEMDYRQGGFIPMGSAERADDVNARVSKNEFVMTADAVRAAGGGSINQGAKKMYEIMNNLEAQA